MNGKAGGVLLLSSLGLAACGGGGSDTRSSAPAAGVPTRPVTSVAVTATGTEPVRTSAAPRAPATTVIAPKPPKPPKKSKPKKKPESAPGGAGDEQGIRVPAVFTIQSGQLGPPSIAIPAFLRIAFTVRNGDGKAYVVAFRGHRLHVAPHGRSSVLMNGLRKGRYPVTVDGRAAGAVVTGAHPGP
jgi:hypothetical protein